MTNLRCCSLSKLLEDKIGRENWMLGPLAIAILTLCYADLRVQAAPPAVSSPQSMAAVSVKATGLTPAVIVRTELSASERQASLDFSIPLKMRNLPELQHRVAQGEIISADEMTAKYYPTADDYQ